MMMISSLNPVDGSVVGTVKTTPVELIPTIVAQAKAAQPAWAELGPIGRRKILAQAEAVIIERADVDGLLMTREMGKPLAEARGEVRSCGSGLEHELAEMEAALADEIYEDERTHSVVTYDALGVCAAITPWNFPYAMPHWMILPALMAGNTVVFKPSEETPLIGQAYTDALNTVLPKDVLQIIHGAEAQGRALVAAEVDLIAFTGSGAAGKAILGAAAPNLKRVILELGGKDPMLVLDDADLPKAAKFAARNSFRNAGQVCVSTERIYVHNSVADEFVKLLAEAAQTMTVGDGLAKDTQIGPMVSIWQRDYVLTQIRDAVAQGATVVVGETGEAPKDNFLQPTVLIDVDPTSLIARDETFGPVVCVFRTQDDDDAVRQANDTPFGLGAAVFSGDVSRGEQVARRLTAGMVGVNQGVGGAGGTPWVGARQSGYGFHQSAAGHRQFAQTRVISHRRS